LYDECYYTYGMLCIEKWLLLLPRGTQVVSTVDTQSIDPSIRSHVIMP